MSTLHLYDIVFPNDANHHGTLFGGVALAHMDKIAFLAASRHGRASFVTASSDRIDFAAPARIGELIEASGQVVRVGTRSLDVAVELTAEVAETGERRLCTRGRFTLVAARDAAALPLPPLPAQVDAGEGQPGIIRMADMVFPAQTNHHGTLHGGDALKCMGKAAFITATKHARAVFVMAASDRIDFQQPIREGDMIELVGRVKMQGRSSLCVAIDLFGENLLSGERRQAASAEFVMVAVGPDGKSRPL